MPSLTPKPSIRALKRSSHPPNMMLAARYRVEKQLGMGGTAVVYEPTPTPTAVGFVLLFAYLFLACEHRVSDVKTLPNFEGIAQRAKRAGRNNFAKTGRERGAQSRARPQEKPQQ